MLNFLNSTVLFAAVVVLVPLLIHLFSKRRVKVVEFSSLKHLKAMQKRQVRRLKIRQLLLLLLRMLIILAVVLAFARPTTTGGSIGSHATESAVILFDNSASMNRQVADGNLFEIARKSTGQLLATFGESDEVVLISLDRTDQDKQTAVFGSSAIAAERLQRLQVGYGEADLESALDAAVALLENAASLNKEIYIVSDRQRRSLPDKNLLAETDARVYLLDLPVEENDNCSITAVDFGGQLLVPGHDFNITATVKNFGTVDRSDIIASLFLDGHRVAQTDVKVNAGQDATVRFTRNLSRGGFHSGFVELSDDRFPTDNSYYFSFRIPEKFNVLIVDSDGAGQFIRLALVPSISTNQYWSVKEVNPEMLSQVDFSDYDVIIFAGAPRLHSSYMSRIESFVKRGKSLFVTYGGTTDIEHFNQEWSEVTGVVFDEPIKQDFTRAGYYTFQTFEVDHPIFSIFGFEKDRPPEIEFYTLPKAHTMGGAQTLASFSGGRPALVQSTFGEGKVLTFTGPVSPFYGDLTSHAFFVPFIARIAEYLASDLSSYDLQLFSGDQITRSVSMKGSFRTSLELLAPDGRTYSIPPEEDKASLVLWPKPTDMPGIYRISYIGREIDRFAVNLNPAEGDLSEVDVDQFAASLGAPDYHLLGTDKSLATVISEMRFGKELWHLFLWAAAILLVAEMALARTAPVEE